MLFSMLWKKSELLLWTESLETGCDCVSSNALWNSCGEQFPQMNRIVSKKQLAFIIHLLRKMTQQNSMYLFTYPSSL